MPQDLINCLRLGIPQAEEYLKDEIDKVYNRVKMISYTEAVMKELESMAKDRLDFFTSSHKLLTVVNIILSLNPACLTVEVPLKHKVVSAISFDNLIILYIKDDDVVKVFKFVWGTHFVETGSIHTKEWLKSLIKVCGFEELLDSV